MRQQTSRRPIGLVLTGLAAVAVIAVVTVVLWRTGESRSTTHNKPIPQPVAYVPRGSRLDAADWATLQHVVQMRTMALAPGRTALYRSFAAYMGLSGLLELHPVRPGRCATAVSYLYDNLLDLHDAFAGEDWRPLRRLIRTQPPLSVCTPRAAPRVTYVS
jgi:hypothetical protein